MGRSGNKSNRKVQTRSCRKEGSFLIDEFGRGISERGNRQHKSSEVQRCLVRSGKGRWFAEAVTKACRGMGGARADRSAVFSRSIPELELQLLSLLCGKSLKDSFCNLFFYYQNLTVT